MKEVIEGRSVRRDETAGEPGSVHLVRHLVRAQSVIIGAAEAGLYNNTEVWEERKNSLSFHSGQTNIIGRCYDWK